MRLRTKLFEYRQVMLGLLLLLPLLWTSCAQSPYKALEQQEFNYNCISKFKPAFNSVLYKTEVNIIGKHIGGLLLFKTQEDSTIRVVFYNEIGIKFFDFEYAKSGFTVKSCIKQLDKKVVINQLKNDIGLLLMYNIELAKGKAYKGGELTYFAYKNLTTTDYYITNTDCSQLLTIENASRKKKKLVIDLMPSKNGMPDSAVISHKNYEFVIKLKQIDRNNAQK